MEYEVTSDLHKIVSDRLILGAEMFEADNQLLLDEYLRSEYEADKFEAEAKLWKNYKTDYKPLVEFARKNDLP
ncbi:MAG TPA: ChaN family lipoprotein, partial [Lentimicrobium sp.]|nr:ChaN family lipoprotein [Lentimicrobium sp.]